MIVFYERGYDSTVLVEIERVELREDYFIAISTAGVECPFIHLESRHDGVYFLTCPENF